jgi:hypothetical protein
MNTSTKAALLSALVFPGAGHLLLKKYVMAALLAAVTMVGAYLLISQAVFIALVIADKINRGEIALDPERIAAAIELYTTAAQSQTADMAVYAVAAAWLVGVIDSFRQGRNARQEPAAKTKQ